MSLVGTLLTFSVALASAANGQWWLEDFELPDSQVDGAGVIVAVIDTGVDDSHPDLAGAVLSGFDFSGVGGEAGNIPVGPGSAHGTMVASLIVGQGAESGGVVGVAPGANVLPISIGLGIPDSDTDTQLAEAVVWAVDNGADVINLSITRNSAKWPQSWDSAFLYAFENDVVVVAASGNEEQGAFATAPATIPGVISVTAVNQAGETSGAAGSSGIGVSIAAPGENLLGSYPGGGSLAWSGSSAAAPIVSGLIALMRQQDPQASANDLIERLLRSATDLGEPGFDSAYGFGLINPSAALSAQDRASDNPLGSLQRWIELYRAEVAEDQAELLLPTVESSEPEAQITAEEKAKEPINPLLYSLLVPLLLLVLLLRRGLGR